MAEHMWLGRVGFQFQKAGVSVSWFLITGWPLTEALSWTAGRAPGTHFSSDHALVAGLLAGRRHPCWATGVSMCSILGTGEPHGQRTLVGYSPWGHKESDTPEQLTHTSHVLVWRFQENRPIPPLSLDHWFLSGPRKWITSILDA